MNKTKLTSDLYLTSPIYNASCPIAVNYKQLDEIEYSWSGAILTKSCTIKPIEINNSIIKRQTKQTWLWYEYDLNSKTSFNRNGLLNPGIDYYLNYNKKKSDKPYIISIAISNSENYLNFIEKINKNNFKPDSLELNLSCPNSSIKNTYDYIKLLENVMKIIDLTDNNIVLGLKLRPTFDIQEINHISNIIRLSNIDYIVCSNTIPNGMSSNGLLGAIGGSSLKPLSLWNVYQYRRRLSSNIGVVGCGGVYNVKDFEQYMKIGANAVQIGTSIYEHGLAKIQDILQQYTGISAKI